MAYPTHTQLPGCDIVALPRSFDSVCVNLNQPSAGRYDLQEHKLFASAPPPPFACPAPSSAKTFW